MNVYRITVCPACGDKPVWVRSGRPEYPWKLEHECYLVGHHKIAAPTPMAANALMASTLHRRFIRSLTKE